MRLLDRTLPSPALNLACDEALLDACEAGEGQEVLRFWEADRPFVVVGHGNRVATEVALDACRSLQVPVLRRCSGGGTVLQGRGCLNYALVLRIGSVPELQSVTRTNAFVMERHRAVLACLVPGEVSVQGITDLAWNGRKVSGNAQRRRRDSLLFHGTFLREIDLDLLERVLPPPSRSPGYRAGRTHRDFLGTLPVGAPELKAALIDAWGAQQGPEPLPAYRLEDLVRARYASEAWNFRT